MDILEVIAPYKHFHKLRQFVDMKLPPGFPVKLGKKDKDDNILPVLVYTRTNVLAMTSDFGSC